MGATLNDSWATGEERNVEDEEIQYSDNPLATGLFHIGGGEEAERCKSNTQNSG